MEDRAKHHFGFVPGRRLLLKLSVSLHPPPSPGPPLARVCSATLAAMSSRLLGHLGYAR